MGRKAFERRLVRTRNKIEKRGQKMAFKAIKAQYKAVFDLVNNMLPQSLLDNVNVSDEPIKRFMGDYYVMFAPIGLMTRNNAINKKDVEDDFYNSVYFQDLRNYGITATAEQVISITATSERFIKDAIKNAVVDGFEQGLGIEDTQRLIRRYLRDSLGDIGRSRAKTIAQTEMITASNYASEKAMDDTGLDYLKFWSTSGLENVRDSHIHAQEAHPNGIRKGEAFDMGDGTFMQRPGDPAGGASNVINCRCTLLHEVI